MKKATNICWMSSLRKKAAARDNDKGQLEGTVNFHDLCGNEPINFSYCRNTSHFHQCDAAEIGHTKHLKQLMTFNKALGPEKEEE